MSANASLSTLLLFAAWYVVSRNNDKQQQNSPLAGRSLALSADAGKYNTSNVFAVTWAF